jgi:hypothetical protein
LFYLFNLERRIPAGNLLRQINPVVTRILVELRDKLAHLYSDIGRPSIDPELMLQSRRNFVPSPMLADRVAGISTARAYRGAGNHDHRNINPGLSRTADCAYGYCLFPAGCCRVNSDIACLIIKRKR